MNYSSRRAAPLIYGVRAANPGKNLGAAHEEFWAQPMKIFGRQAIDIADVAKLVDALV
jgi:hypothetical protein